MTWQKDCENYIASLPENQWRPTTPTVSVCPACGATDGDVQFLGVHHEIVAEFRCLACETVWSD